MKFPYNGNFEINEDDYFSEKFCQFLLISNQKVKKKLIYLEGIVSIFATSLGMSPIKSIGLPISIFPRHQQSIMSYLKSNDQNFSIASVNNNEESRIRINKNYPQIADIPASKVDKIRLTNEQIKQFDSLALQLSSGSITMEEAILTLRGGDGVIDIVVVIAFVIFVNWYDSSFGVEGFQANPLPHQDPFGWLSGKYDSKNAGNDQSLSHPPSRFERETLHRMKQMCAASADENGFIMSYDEAYNLIKNTYSGSMQITDDCRITDN